MKLLMTLSLLFLTACASVSPRNYDESVWYTYATVEVIVSAAAAFVADPATGPEIDQPVIDAMTAARPYIVALHDADVAVDEARAALAAGTGTQEKLDIALALLKQAEANAVVPINKVLNAVGGK